MPKPHIQTTIASLSENWFMGPELGPKYGLLLSDALALRGDHAAIDATLGLGAYVVHSQANKDRRQVVRATLLAAFLMKRQPLAVRDALIKQYERKSLDALKSEFKNLFPALVDTNRGAWAPANFTSLTALTAYRHRADWTNAAPPAYMLMVHSLRHGSAVLDSPIATLSTWLAVSTGVLSNNKPAFTEQGLILGIPANNIITTSPTDQWFDNYAGTNRSVKAIGVTMAEHIIDKNLRIGGLLTPAQVAARQGTPQAMQNFAGVALTPHNEVVICGVPNALVPWGRTGQLTLLGLFLQVKLNGTSPPVYMKSQGPAHLIEVALTAAAVKLGVPLLFLPNASL